MKRLDALAALRSLDSMGRYVMRRDNLRAFFPNESEKTFSEGLGRLVSDGLLVQATRGVYVNEAAKSKDAWTIERIAIALRPADTMYVSLESALSEYGVISQIPIDRITLMTTGRSGEIATPYGVIELTHSKRTPEALREGYIKQPGRPLPIATVQTALRDLRRVGRNLHLVDREALNEVIGQAAAEDETEYLENNPARQRQRG